MSKTYFAADGSFGNADGLLIVDTHEWDASDWQAIDYATDRERAIVALHISKQYDGAVEVR